MVSVNFHVRRRAKRSSVPDCASLYRCRTACTRMAKAIQQSADLWDLEHYLTQRRKEIDRKYDYRHSQLTQGVRQALARKTTQ